MQEQWTDIINTLVREMWSLISINKRGYEINVRFMRGDRTLTLKACRTHNIIECDGVQHMVCTDSDLQHLVHDLQAAY